MNEQINILCATDANYAALCGVMLTSLLENNRNSNIRIFMFTQGISDEDRIKYDQLAKRYDAEVNVLTIDQSKFADCPIWSGDHLSVAAYYRLMAATLLPETIDKILYLDCDIIVNDSLEPIWKQDIDDVAIGAVADAEFYKDEFYERLCLPKDKVYFNSGVLLINLKYWRQNDVQERCFSCIENQRERLRFHDQDTLNVVLQDEVKLLPIVYNFQTPFLLTVFSKLYVSEIVNVNDILKTSGHPMIIHYIGGGKPWQGHSNHPFKSHFMYYKRRSLWKKVNLEKQKISFLDNLMWTLMNVLRNLGLKSRPQTYIIKSQRKK